MISVFHQSPKRLVMKINPRTFIITIIITLISSKVAISSNSYYFKLKITRGRKESKQENVLFGNRTDGKTCGDAMLKYADLLQRVKSAEVKIKEGVDMMNYLINDRVRKALESVDAEYYREYRRFELFFLSYEKAIDAVRDEQYENCIEGRNSKNCESEIFKRMIDCAWMKPDKRWICGKEMEVKKYKVDQVFRLGLKQIDMDINQIVQLINKTNNLIQNVKNKCQENCQCLQDEYIKSEKNIWEKIKEYTERDLNLEIDRLIGVQKEGLPNYKQLKTSTIDLVRLYSCCLEDFEISIKGYPCEKLTEPTKIEFPTENSDYK